MNFVFKERGLRVPPRKWKKELLLRAIEYLHNGQKKDSTMFPPSITDDGLGDDEVAADANSVYGHECPLLQYKQSKIR